MERSDNRTVTFGGDDQSEARPASPVQAQVNILANQHNVTEILLNRLETKLDSVLRGTPPKPDVATAKPGAASESPLHAELQAATHRATHINDRLEALLQRLTV